MIQAVVEIHAMNGVDDGRVEVVAVSDDDDSGRDAPDIRDDVAHVAVVLAIFVVPLPLFAFARFLPAT